MTRPLLKGFTAELYNWLLGQPPGRTLTIRKIQTGLAQDLEWHSSSQVRHAILVLCSFNYMRPVYPPGTYRQEYELSSGPASE